ncbi:VOC family protein [Neptunicoccus sediminis]|uniref:VOC family protein n=1 Tax=Neptunicoccus sediminis TaxID=1892596 RepID=UPI000845E104|nr:VOC family protein [Neptunicoccus sediminis]
MIDHSGISVSDFDAAKAFYLAALAPLDGKMLMEIPSEHTGGVKVAGFGRDAPTFWISENGQQKPAMHVAFAARNHTEVDAFYKAAIAAGGEDNGAPGPRPHYHEHYYGAFVRDPDGNNVEAVCHAPQS